MHKTWPLRLVYKAVNISNILSMDGLEKIREFEMKIRNLPGWRRLCSQAVGVDAARCNPGRSLVNYIFVEDENDPRGNVQLNFTGKGEPRMPISAAVVFLWQRNLLEFFLPKLAVEKDNIGQLDLAGNVGMCADRSPKCESWKQHCSQEKWAPHVAYMSEFCAKTCGFCTSPDDGGSQSKMTVKTLQSIFVFRIPCCFKSDPKARKKVAKLQQMWTEFLEVELYKVISDPFAIDGIRVYYTADGMEAKEVMDTLYSDSMYALGSFTFVWLYLFLHTRSPMLATMGLLLIFLSIPAGFAVFSIVAGSGRMTIASFLSLFLIIGIGSDMLFVYTDFWKQSLSYTRDEVKRLKFTYCQAGKSTAATTFTTAMSFIANLASVLRGLREFGFFMGVCVTAAYILVLVGYPTILLLNDRIYECLKRVLVTPLKKAPPEKKSIARASVVLGNTVRNTVRTTVVDFLNPAEKGIGQKIEDFFQETFVDGLFRLRYLAPFLFLSWSLFGLGQSALNAEVNTAMPALFPEEHNQVAGKAAIELFIPYGDKDSMAKEKTEIPTAGSLCEMGAVGPDGEPKTDCLMNECLSGDRLLGTRSECVCTGYALEQCNSQPSSYNLRVQIVQPADQKAYALQAVSTDVRNALMRRFQAFSVQGGPTSDTAFGPLFQYNWESGMRIPVLASSPFDYNVQLIGTGDACSLLAICYCGTRQCEMPDATTLMKVPLYSANESLSRSLTSSEDDLDPGFDDSEYIEVADDWIQANRYVADVWRQPRTLQDSEISDDDEGQPLKPTVARKNQATVTVVFGLEVVGEDKMLGQDKNTLWAFDPDFEPGDPLFQRQALALCNLASPEMKALKVVEVDCWLDTFRDWLSSSDEKTDHPYLPKIRQIRYPIDTTSEDFHALVHLFTQGNQVTNKKPTDNYVWVRDGKLVAMIMDFKINVVKYAGAVEGLAEMARWEKHFEAFNQQLLPRAGGWHTAKLWVQSEAAIAIVSSTLTTFSISCGCAFIGMVIFTESPQLSCIAVINIVCVIALLLWFMVIVMQWVVGPLEVLSLIVFVGFAVDYSLHISHQYGDAVLEKMTDSTTRLNFDPARDSQQSGVSGGSSFLARNESNPSLGKGSSSNTLGASGKPRASQRFTIRYMDGYAPALNPAEEALNKMGSNKLLARGSAVELTEEQVDSLDKDPEAERFERVRFSLRRMAGATLGSAVTTAGSAAFLTMCTLQIFVKLGTVVLAVTLLSILFALVPLPATLMIAGPTDRAKQKWKERVKNAKSHMSNAMSHYDLASRRNSHQSLFFSEHEGDPSGHPMEEGGEVWNTGDSKHKAHSSRYVLGFVKPMTKKTHDRKLNQRRLDING